MSELEAISYLLELSLNPASARHAETQLKAEEDKPGFALTLLHVIASTNLTNSIRLAGALFLKNYVKRKWVDENGNHLSPDAERVKAEITSLMITLPSNLQVQIGETISLIADSDFPDKWPTLIDDFVAKISEDDMYTNKGVLIVAHSIFKRWRPLFRSDELFLEIKLVLSKFSVPFLNLLQRVDALIDQNKENQAQLVILLEVLYQLVKIYYDLNCQDIPEFFEDNLNVGMGIMHKYLVFDSPFFKPKDSDDDDDDEEVDILSKVKTSICELIQLYTARYEDVFEPLLPQFIQSTWNLLTTIGPQQRFDILTSKLLSFLTTVVRLPTHSDIFNNEVAIKEISERIIIPNLSVRTSDEELFEDDPIEYIRRDLEGSDADTRRRASIDFLRELKVKNENLTTQTILKYIEHYLAEFQANPNNWKSKDLAIYLFTALAAKGSVTSSGVTATNLLLDIVGFFTNNIVNELLNTNSHPILKVDAIKYIYTFRNQLTKNQLLESFPILVSHLDSNQYVEYTYAAITIEKILSIKDSNQSNFQLFQKNDIKPFNLDLLTKLFKLITQFQSTPEKLAENEFLMKTVMRVLLIAEDTVEEYATSLAEQLLNIISIVAKNPSNPRFNHFTFESIAVIIKYNHSTKWQELVAVTMGSLLGLLGEDVQEFVPYIFQIFAYLLEISPASQPLPDTFKQLIIPLLSPSVWEFKGNIPAVARLLRSIICKDFSSFGDSEIEPLLGVFQKLISSKANEDYGFELVESIILSAAESRIAGYTKNIAILLLQRLQNSRTEKFVKRLISFVSKLTIIKSSSYAIGFFDQVQPEIFAKITSQFLIPSLQNINNLTEKKIAIVGFTNIVFDESFIKGPYSSMLIPTLSVLLQITTSSSIKTQATDNAIGPDLDFDEPSSFGSSFSRLATIGNKPFDPVSSLSNVNGGALYLTERIKKSDLESGGVFVNGVKSQVGPDVLKALTGLGF
ncbi:hypothetical protein WICPIJ_001163 [Wickerhamomyces pijperi]|uniref:Importin N-terminal domain-containing protein n=1 Tax=Wickerhamomyces pijperi TaxID=599730 RepID=A0A9P8QE17_WICPI|nr:hypothetical protein WICPIJ_001163 [Wickerhamomyces pijperi]